MAINPDSPVNAQSNDPIVSTEGKDYTSGRPIGENPSSKIINGQQNCLTKSFSSQTTTAPRTVDVTKLDNRFFLTKWLDSFIGLFDKGYELKSIAKAITENVKSNEFGKDTESQRSNISQAIDILNQSISSAQDSSTKSELKFILNVLQANLKGVSPSQIEQAAQFVADYPQYDEATVFNSYSYNIPEDRIPSAVQFAKENSSSYSEDLVFNAFQFAETNDEVINILQNNKQFCALAKEIKLNPEDFICHTLNSADIKDEIKATLSDFTKNTVEITERADTVIKLRNQLKDIKDNPRSDDQNLAIAKTILDNFKQLDGDIHRDSSMYSITLNNTQIPFKTTAATKQTDLSQLIASLTNDQIIALTSIFPTQTSIADLVSLPFTRDPNASVISLSSETYSQRTIKIDITTNDVSVEYGFKSIGNYAEAIKSNYNHLKEHQGDPLEGYPLNASDGSIKFQQKTTELLSKIDQSNGNTNNEELKTAILADSLKDVHIHYVGMTQSFIF